MGEWVAAHHERPDGRGYPELLSAGELSTPPRIFAVADAYWALRAERPYRAAFSEDETMVLIELGVDRQFDARIVGALPEVLVSIRDAEAAEAAG